MNSLIKRRQTLLINWLIKTLSCNLITKAETGSCYLELSTSYTGKSTIRISDHLSADKSYIHVILSPLNKTVIINYKNFIWSGSFKESKSVIYTLIMSKAMVSIVSLSQSNNLDDDLIKLSDYLINWGNNFKESLINWIKKHPQHLKSFSKFVKKHCTDSKDLKIKYWDQYIKEHI